MSTQKSSSNIKKNLKTSELINEKNIKQKENNKTKKLLIIILSVILFTLLIVGITYAYFLNQETTEFGKVISGNLNMSYLAGEDLLLTNATPIYEKDVSHDASYVIFSIENKGTVNMYTDISIENIAIDSALRNSSFKWRIEQGSSATEEGFNDSFIIDSGTFEGFNSTSKLLVTNRYLEPGEIKYYKISVWVEENGGNQNDIMGAKFKAKVKAVGYAKTKSKTFASSTPVLNNTSINRNISNLKLYGNSVQSTTPSTITPAEIASVGDLITDIADENYGKYEIPVTVNAKNLFDESKLTQQSNYNTYDESTGLWTTSSANSWQRSILYSVVGTSNRNINKIIKVPRNTDITIKVYDLVNNTSYKSAALGYVFFNENGEKITDIYTGNEITTIKTPDQEVWLDIQRYYNTGTISFSKIQIEYGSTATEYEPYQEPLTYDIYLEEPLRTIGKYQDYIDFENKQVVRRVKKLVANGTENWILTNNYLSNCFNLNLPDMVSNEQGAGILIYSTHFQGSNSWLGFSNRLNKITAYRQHLGIGYTDGNGNIGVMGSTVDSFKSWLKSQNDNGTPLKIYYPLKNAEAEKIDLPNIKTLGGTNTLSVNSAISGSFSGTY